MAKLERNTYTNLSRTAANSLVKLMQEDAPLDLQQSFDPDSGKYIVSVIREIDEHESVSGR